MTKKTLQVKALKALREAVLEVVEQHKRSKRPLAVWRNGKAAKVSASRLLHGGK